MLYKTPVIEKLHCACFEQQKKLLLFLWTIWGVLLYVKGEGVHAQVQFSEGAQQSLVHSSAQDPLSFTM